MAEPIEEQPETSFSALNSYDTALCWIPDAEYWPCLDRLRSLYDKAYEKWPPHVNLVYPFVAPESLERAAEAIVSGLQSQRSGQADTPRIHLNSTGVFTHRKDNTIYLCDDDAQRRDAVSQLRKDILRSLSHKSPLEDVQMHMTIGQSQDHKSDSHHFLVQKAGLLPKLQCGMNKLHILIREKSLARGNTKTINRMIPWGIIDLTSVSLSIYPNPPPFYCQMMAAELSEVEEGSVPLIEVGSLSQLPYRFDPAKQCWVSYEADVPYKTHEVPTSLTVASYNVLAEFNFPVSGQRFPILVDNVLDKAARSDILVLQEAADDFLTHLLGNASIRAQYPFVSHGPPHQDDLEPLPSHLNTVILSRFRFTWRRVALQRRHKISIVAQFSDLDAKVINMESAIHSSSPSPLVLATVHLTCGLTDGSVTAKKLELQAVLKYLREYHPDSPWILAGDFNISTSAHTIGIARQKGVITSQTVTSLRDLDSQMTESGFIDSWATAKILRGDGRSISAMASEAACDYEDQAEIFEGEEGATYDPLTNQLAAEVVGSGFNMRPQRYDRILVRGHGLLDVVGFNMFGQALGVLGPRQPEKDDSSEPNMKFSYGSDHWGVRCSLKIRKGVSDAGNDTQSDISTKAIQVRILKPPDTLEDAATLKKCLEEHQFMPSSQDAELREHAIRLLKEVVLQSNSANTDNEAMVLDPVSRTTASVRGQPSFVMIPVGSHGLGVWTTSSDIDCLCIGPVSSKVFFSLAAQRIRKAEQQQRYQIERDGVTSSSIRLVRRVNAHSGTMFELDVLGIKMDLQYCASAFIAETWPYATRVAPNDPTFQLTSMALAKLKPMRDLYYLRRTVPDYAAFRTAYLLIKLWAKKRGIYSAKFGYLGGIHISIMLLRVCKMMSHTCQGHTSSMSATTILTTFFSHYADFDWQTRAVYDPFFHSEGGSGRALRYVRTAREPLAILGWHGPALNVAVAASTPTAKTIADEFRRAAVKLSNPDMTWQSFVDSASESRRTGTAQGDMTLMRDTMTSGAVDFLTSFKSYVKIEAQFWGVSLSKGTGFVGWLESRCTLLLVDLDRRVPGVHARIWPARFVEREAAANGGGVQDYKGYYLVGLEPSKKSESASLDPGKAIQMTKDETKAALGALRTALSKFEGQIRGDERFFDAKSCWMSASIVNRQDLGTLVLDDREWGEYTIGDEDEEEEDTEEEDDEDEDEHSEDIDTANQHKSNKKKNRRDNTRNIAARPAYQGKFRSSADVINRLRWDPDLDSSEYIVGYEDRFLGVRERALDAWKSEQTDEEFIPQHRILYFKRRGAGDGGDGAIVWDRGQRKDVIFGSGVSSLGQ